MAAWGYGLLGPVEVRELAGQLGIRPTKTLSGLKRAVRRASQVRVQE
jgi:hypothetical protein